MSEIKRKMKKIAQVNESGSILFYAFDTQLLGLMEKKLGNADIELFQAMDAKQALKILQEREIDILMLDYTPGQNDHPDLVDFLKTLKKKYPTANRVALVKENHREDAIRLLVKGLITSHFEKELIGNNLLDTIFHILYARRTLKNKNLLTLFKKVEQLPTCPKVYHEFMDALENDRSIKEITHIIEKDASIATRVLQVANSDLSRGRIGSIERACIYLGLDTVKNIVFAVSLTTPKRLSVDFHEYLEKIIFHSFQVNQNFQKMFLTQRGRPLPEQFSTIGITHDIGKIILLQYLPMRFNKIIRYQKNNPEIGFYRSEVELGFQEVTHAEIGAYFLNLWNFPEASVYSALFHHSTEEFPEPYKEALDIFAIVNDITNTREAS